MRVMIAVPTFESITPDTFQALWDMDKGGHDCDFRFVRGYDCATARNRIAQIALDCGYDHVLMVDSDVTLPPDALVNLMSHGVEFVSGYYLHRDSKNRLTDRTCVCKLQAPDGTEWFDYPLESAYTSGELSALRESGDYLVEIHGCGMGCALVKTEVFRRLRFPWFKWTDYPGAERKVLSEDLHFCEVMRKARIRRHVDTRVSCGHLFRSVERP